MISIQQTKALSTIHTKKKEKKKWGFHDYMIHIDQKDINHSITRLDVLLFYFILYKSDIRKGGIESDQNLRCWDKYF